MSAKQKVDFNAPLRLLRHKGSDAAVYIQKMDSLGQFCHLIIAGKNRSSYFVDEYGHGKSDSGNVVHQIANREEKKESRLDELERRIAALEEAITKPAQVVL